MEVTDSGAGLSEEEQNGIFGEFTQFNKNKLQGGGDLFVIVALSRVCVCHAICCIVMTGGSGLGLWISRRIVHMHKVQYK